MVGMVYDVVEVMVVEIDCLDLMGYLFVDWIFGEEFILDEIFNV